MIRNRLFFNRSGVCVFVLTTDLTTNQPFYVPLNVVLLCQPCEYISVRFVVQFQMQLRCVGGIVLQNRPFLRFGCHSVTPFLHYIIRVNAGDIPPRHGYPIKLISSRTLRQCPRTQRHYLPSAPATNAAAMVCRTGCNTHANRHHLPCIQGC